MELRPLLNYLDSFVFHVDAFWEHHITEEPNLFLIKTTFFQIDKWQELPELFQYQLYGYDVTIPIIFSVNQNVVQIHNNKNVKLLRKSLVDVFLEAC